MPIMSAAKMGLGYLPQEASHFSQTFRLRTIFFAITGDSQRTSIRAGREKELENLLDECTLDMSDPVLALVCRRRATSRKRIARALAADPLVRTCFDEPFRGC